MSKNLSNKIKNLIVTSHQSLIKFTNYKGEYPKFEADTKKINQLKQDIKNIYRKQNLEIKLFETLCIENLVKIETEYKDVLSDELLILEKEISKILNEKKKIKEEKIKIKNKKKLNNKSLNATKSNKDKFGVKFKNTPQILSSSNQSHKKNYNILKIGGAIAAIFLLYFNFSNDVTYDKNNKWVKECLAIGIRGNNDVANCAERQKNAFYQYQNVQKQNEILKEQIKNSNKYAAQSLREQKYQNDLAKNQILLNLSKDLMGLNRPANNNSFNCLFNPMGFSCR